MALTNQQLEDRVLLIEDLLNKVVRIVNNSLVTRELFTILTTLFKRSSIKRTLSSSCWFVKAIKLLRKAL